MEGSGGPLAGGGKAGWFKGRGPAGPGEKRRLRREVTVGRGEGEAMGRGQGEARKPSPENVLELCNQPLIIYVQFLPRLEAPPLTVYKLFQTVFEF